MTRALESEGQEVGARPFFLRLKGQTCKADRFVEGVGLWELWSCLEFSGSLWGVEGPAREAVGAWRVW